MEPLARQRAATAAAWRADVSTRPDGDWADLDGLLVHTTGLPFVHWNGAIVTRDLSSLPRARDWFAERGMPWGVLVPAELDLDPGTGHVTDQRVMMRPLSDLPPVPDLDLRWDSLEDCALVQSEAFGDPVDVARSFVGPKLVNAACAVVVAYDGARPVATATLVAVDGVAAVYGVGTVQDARRQGLGRAVTLSVLHEGVRRGCDLAFLNPSALGSGMYRALGFAEAPPYRVYRALS